MTEKMIVVGGGLAGLTAATFLARAGCEVTLFEKAHAPGGRAMTAERNNIRFNLGPHALYRSGQAYRILRELGVDFSGAVPKSEGSLAIAGGRAHALPYNAWTLMTTGLFGISAKLEAARLLSTLPALDAQGINRLTVRDWLAKTIRHAGVRQLVQALFRVSTYANDPDRQSAGAALSQLQMALKESVIYLDGGWQTLVDGLRAKAAAAGVRIISESRVATIERDALNGQVSGVRLANGERHTAAAVVLAVSPHEALELIEGGQPSTLGKWAGNAVPVKAACLDIALARLPRPQTTFALGIDRPLYLSVHSAAAKLAPEGNAVIHAAMYLGPDTAADPSEIRRELEGLLDLVQPGWRELVIEQRFLPAMTVTNALVTAEQDGNGGRPGPEVPGIARLYVAGDWVGAEGQLADASVASVKRAAKLAMTGSTRHAVAAAA